MRKVHRTGRLWLLALAGSLASVALIALAGCGSSGTGSGGLYGSNGSGSPTNTPATGGAAFKVNTKSVTVNGKATTVLADANNKTLYYFTPDTPTTAACTAGCAQTWPPLLLPSGASIGQESLPGNLTMVSTANGSQVEYNGHLLYTFSGDQSATDAKGEGILGKWFVATPDLAPSSGGGGGYHGGSPSPTSSGSGAQPTPTYGYSY
jgi:predicted lipoprotein with Yx(FWY)xxD motif